MNAEISVKRNASVEAFRCLLMALIVTGHCYCRGLWYANGALWTLFFTTFIHWHVDAFVGISGWFGIKSTFKKFIRIWALMLFYNIVGCALTWWLYPEVFSWPQLFSLGGWFGGCYLALMLIAPLVNAGVEKVVASGRKDAIIAGGGVLLLVAFTWLPGHLLTGVNANGSGQYSFINMLGVYVIARILKEIELEHIGLNKLMLGVAIFALSILFIGGIKSLLQVCRGLPPTAATWDFLALYDAPHYWVMALTMLLIFVWHVHVPEWFGRVCVFIAPSMFPIYLMHETTGIGRVGIFKLESFLDATWKLHPCVTILITAFSVFSTCLLIDLGRRFVCTRFK